MKKYIATISALVMALGIVSCSDSDSSSKADSKEATATTTTTATVSAADTSSNDASEPDDASSEDGGSETDAAKAPAGVYEYNIVGSTSVLGMNYLDLAVGEEYESTYQLGVDDDDLMDALNTFSRFFTIKTDASSGKLGDYELISVETGKSLGQLSADEIDKMFNPTRNYETVPLSLDKDISLSALEAGKLYKAATVDEMPKFINDTGTDLLLWIMDDFEYREEAFVRPLKEIEGIGRTDETMFFFGDNTYIRIEPLTAELLASGKPGLPETAYVNGVGKGEEVFAGIAQLLVNAGDTDVDIEITPSSGEPISMTVKAGEIYAIDWMNVGTIVIK